MKRPDSDLRLVVAEWIRKADLDFRAVVRLMPEAEFRDLVAFHAQQASEKYLKALLTRHQIEFPKTHEIRLLLERLKPAEPDLARELFEARWLDPFAVDVPYPSDQGETLPGDEVRAGQLAHSVRNGVMARLEPFLSAE